MVNTNESKRPLSYANAALIILCFCYFVPNFAQYEVSPLGMTLIEQFGLTTGQLSSLFSAPMIPAIFLSLIGGILIDKIGPRIIIGTGLIIAALGCIFRIFTYSFSTLMIATAMTGFAACFINAGSGKILGSFFGSEKVSSKMGILMAASTAGMTIAMLIGARFPSIQAAFTFAAVLAGASVILWFLFMKDPMQAKPLSENPSMAEHPAMRECLQKAIKSRNVWIVSFAMFFIMAANVVFSSFTPTALSKLGVSAVVAGNISSCITFGNFLGCFAAPFCIKKWGSQKKVLIAFGILAGIGIAFSWLIPVPVLTGVAFLLTGMFLGGMIPTLMSLPVQFHEIGPIYAGTAGGVIGTIQLLGAVIVPSYVIAPIAGNNFLILFLLGGICMIFSAMLSLILHDIK